MSFLVIYMEEYNIYKTRMVGKIISRDANEKWGKLIFDFRKINLKTA